MNPLELQHMTVAYMRRIRWEARQAGYGVWASLGELMDAKKSAKGGPSLSGFSPEALHDMIGQRIS